MTSFRSLCGLFACAVLCLGWSGMVSAAAECTTDADCTGQDICVQGRCVSPVADKEAPKGLPGFVGLFSVGSVFENSYGGLAFSGSVCFGGSSNYFAAGLHLRAGARWEDSDAKMLSGVEVGYRYMKQLDSGMVPHFLITFGFNHLIQFDVDHGTEYHWDIPRIRIGGGIMWSANRRTKIGFEVSYSGGYAFHTNAADNPWGEVYEWQYSAGLIHYLMAF